MGIVYEQDPIFRAVMYSGQIRLPDLIVRVSLDPRTFTEHLAALAGEEAVIVSATDVPDASSHKLLDRLGEIAQAEEAEDLNDWRRRFLKGVDADPELTGATARLSPRELRKFATA